MLKFVRAGLERGLGWEVTCIDSFGFWRSPYGMVAYIARLCGRVDLIVDAG
jgi:hypothetical protein